MNLCFLFYLVRSCNCYKANQIFFLKKEKRKHFEENKEGHAFISVIERKMFCAKLSYSARRAPALRRIYVIKFWMTSFYSLPVRETFVSIYPFNSDLEIFRYLFSQQVLIQNIVIFAPCKMQPLVSRDSETKPAQQIQIHWVQLIVLLL